ncbi:AAA family ATPase [Caldivirga sp. UBA161]|uniref:AAA family ATPase n=1 Tax=Caldivirga sp. UBA161 TaxID=1915569 RepID=UPI0025B9A75A|nr:AAA family ATPase [Caldivirga sp. UBA161]
MYREPFTELADLRKLLNWLRKLNGDSSPNICVFSGTGRHWFWSLKYSMQGERGYTVWGDSLRSSSRGIDELTGIPFSALVKRYRDGLIDSRFKIKNLNSIKPLLGLFYISDLGYVGFGLITDVDFDVYRNFKYWIEDEDRRWLIRWRMRVLWIDDSIRSLLLKHNDYGEFEKELSRVKDELTINKILRDLKILTITNNCLNNEKSNLTWSRIKELLNDDAVDAMVKFYEESTMFKQFPPGTQLPGGFNKGLISEVLSEIKGKLHGVDEALLRRFIVSALLGNVMLVGPPGMGKTTLAELLAKVISGSKGYMIKTANSLWFRRDVIGGETIENGTVKWVSGFLIKAFNKAAEGLGASPFFLIIDELNRADVDKAFGEFFTIFRSPNPEDWELPSELINEVREWVNGNKADEEAGEFIRNYDKYGDEALRKLRVIAVINAVDLRNLFLIGNALVRRFQVIEVKCPSNTTDVEGIVNTLKLNIPIKAFGSIINYIRYLRSDSKLSRQVCVSTGAVLNALHVVNGMMQVGELNPSDEQALLIEFNEALKSSLGVVSTRVLHKIDERLEEFRRQNKVNNNE